MDPLLPHGFCVSCGEDRYAPERHKRLDRGVGRCPARSLRQCYDRQLAECPEGLPNIQKLTGGRIVDITVTNGATDTKAGWTQNLTGYDAEITGVFNNSRYQPIADGLSISKKWSGGWARRMSRRSSSPARLRMSRSMCRRAGHQRLEDARDSRATLVLREVEGRLFRKWPGRQ